MHIKKNYIMFFVVKIQHMNCIQSLYYEIQKMSRKEFLIIIYRFLQYNHIFPLNDCKYLDIP